MDLSILVPLLGRRRVLGGHDRWPRARLDAHQAAALRTLRRFVLDRSPFYRRFHAGLADRPLAELPVLTKGLLMEQFDALVTDPRIRLADVQEHLAGLVGDALYLGRYRLSATSGSTGHRGLFLASPHEWTTILASYARANAWGGARAGLTHRMRLAVVSTTTPWHQSARVGTTLRSRWVPTLRVDATEPVETIVGRLNAWQPETLVAYASMAGLLAGEQLAGRLRIAPTAIFTASEVLTAAARRRVAAAWGRDPSNVYAATETATIAADCERHRMHLFEDLVVAEVVDAQNRPVPPGAEGDKVLVTVLFSRTQPLIRYALSDQIRLSTEPCACGRPYGVLAGVTGRAEDVLHLPAAGGGEVAVHPNAFHNAIEAAPVGGWQVLYDNAGLHLLVAGPVDAGLAERLRTALQRELGAVGAVPPPIEVRPVPALPRAAAGKLRLISRRA